MIFSNTFQLHKEKAKCLLQRFNTFLFSKNPFSPPFAIYSYVHCDPLSILPSYLVFQKTLVYPNTWNILCQKYQGVLSCPVIFFKPACFSGYCDPQFSAQPITSWPEMVSIPMIALWSKLLCSLFWYSGSHYVHVVHVSHDVTDGVYRTFLSKKKKVHDLERSIISFHGVYYRTTAPCALWKEINFVSLSLTYSAQA